MGSNGMVCIEMRRLLDAYLMALAADSEQSTRQTKTELLSARREFWAHVEKHGCRPTRPTSEEIQS